MTPTGLVIILVAAPAVVLTVLRVNAAMVFLSLCLGQVLVQFVGKDAANTVGIIAAGTGRTNPEMVSLGLLLVPAVFTALFMARTVKGNFRLVLNVLPAISVGILAFLLAEPHFTPGLRGAIESSPVWHITQELQVIAIGASAIVSLFFLWLQRPKSHHDKDEKHHK
jgi:hypothetical protein